MSLYLRDTVIILKKEPFREQDRWYTFYGKTYGLFTAVARGSASRASKQCGHLEPLTVAEVMVAKGAAFDKLAVAKQVEHFKVGEMEHFSFYVLGGAFADVCIQLLRPGIAEPVLFHLMHELLVTTSLLPQELSATRGRVLLAASILKLMDVLGFAPLLSSPAAGTSPVPSLLLVSFMRRQPLVDILRVTATVEVLNEAANFVFEALRQTPLEREPKGISFVGEVLR